MKSKVIITDSQIMGGTPVFKGTRVPLEVFIDYLESGSSIEDFLIGFPTVSRRKIIAFLEEAKKRFFVHA